jgi:outer membrane protein OmpA-like peptidoglycan-associated protein
MNKYTFLLYFLCTGLFINAQDWEVGLQGGLSQYYGDVTNNEISLLGESRNPYGGLFVRGYFGNALGVRFNGNIAEYAGNDINTDAVATRGLSFKSNSVELSAQLEYHLLGRERRFSPYVFGGLGFLQAYARPEFSNAVSSIRDRISADRALGADKAGLVIPLGVGLNFHPIKDNLTSVGIEYSLRPTSMDLLDGISNAGDPDNNDWGGTLGLVVGFPIGGVDTDGDGVSDKRDECPNTFGLKLFNGCPDTDSDGIIDSADNCPNASGTAENMGCPDSDGDGIIDKDDSCPNTAGLANMRGCPDSDGDGVKDSDDNCPSVKGRKNMAGCPDTDRDGVPDKDDDCPTEKGLKTNKGCPNPDSDGDGVVDANDACPNKAGPADNKGCPNPDSDGDGVADKDDSCPRIAGTLRGCPDTDKDGIADKDDRCPTKGGNIDANGCPKVDAKTLEVFSRAMNDVRFETSSNRLKQSSQAVLNEVVDIMKANPSYNVRISGHTDSVGNSESNQSLSERRAAAVVNYLVGKGISQTRLSSVGFGETSPIADNNTAEGRRLNRRVELRVVN